MREHAVQVMVAAEQAFKLGVSEPWALRSQIALAALGITLLIHHLVNILVVVEEHWLRLEHFGDRDVPVCPPFLLLELGEVV